MYFHATILTHPAIAANNRGEGDGGNTMNLQTVTFGNNKYTTVSSESMRWAYREYWQSVDIKKVNRQYDHIDDSYSYQDESHDETKFIDDDLFGYMEADKKTVNKRRGPVEMSRALSIHPDYQEKIFNSRGGNPAEKNRLSLYNTSIHGTQYQYTISCKLDDVTDKSNIPLLIDAIFNLRHVGGNHARYLYDFTPESIVLRVTESPAPNIMFCFDYDDESDTIGLSKLIRLVRVKDLDADELIIGGLIAESSYGKALEELGCICCPGVKEAVSTAQYAVKKAL